MKKMRKIFAVLLTLAMVLAMSIPTFAADNVIGNSDDEAEIKVTNVDSATSVKAYPIIKATYGENGDFNGYQVLYTTTPEITATKHDDNTLEYTISEEQIAGIRNSLHNDGITMSNTTENPTTYSVVAPIGAYLIVVEGSETSTYNSMIVSTNYKNEAGVNAIDITKNTAVAKKADKPTFNKTIKEESETKKGNSVNIGDTINYELTINNIPKYEGKYPIFNVTDKLSNGLTFNGEDVSVKIGDTTLTKDVDYKFSKNNQVITINFVDNNLTAEGKTSYGYTLNKYASSSMTISYSATLNNSAALNEIGNNNDAELKYSKDSSVNSNEVTEKDKTYTYTFDIGGDIAGTETSINVDVLHLINKVGEETKTIEINGEKKTVKAALKEAEFTIYKDESCTNKYTNAVEKDGIVKSNENGQIELKGLKADTYYLKETKAPNGYSVNATPVKVEIIAEYYTEGETNGRLKLWTLKVNNSEVARFNPPTKEGEIKWIRTDSIEKDGTTEFSTGYDILNTKLSSLPSTGGIGTTIFTIAGCLIMVTAAGLFFASRKRTNK